MRLVAIIIILIEGQSSYAISFPFGDHTGAPAHPELVKRVALPPVADTRYKSVRQLPTPQAVVVTPNANCEPSGDVATLSMAVFAGSPIRIERRPDPFGFTVSTVPPPARNKMRPVGNHCSTLGCAPITPLIEINLVVRPVGTLRNATSSLEAFPGSVTVL